MLVLGRRVGETIFIGDNIKIKVVSGDGEIKLAIDAPKELRIMRGELQERQGIKDYMESTDPA